LNPATPEKDRKITDRKMKKSKLQPKPLLQMVFAWQSEKCFSVNHFSVFLLIHLTLFRGLLKA